MTRLAGICFLALLPSIGLGQEPSSSGDSLIKIFPGTEVAGTLAGRESRRYRVVLPQPGHWLIAVEQRGLDGELIVTPEDSDPAKANSPAEFYGIDSLVVETQGVIEIELRSNSFSSHPGSYLLRTERLDEGSSRLAAEIATSEGNAIARLDDADAKQRAADFYLASLETRRTLGDQKALANALFLTAEGLRAVDQASEAIVLLKEANELYGALQDYHFQSVIWNAIGLSLLYRTEYEESDAALTQAMSLQSSVDDPVTKANIRNNQCLLLHYQGEMYSAIDCYNEVLPVFEALADIDGTGLLHNNLGRAYDVVGKPVEARRHLELAVEQKRQVGNLRDTAMALNNLALLERRLGYFNKAIPIYLEALEIQNRLGLDQPRSATLNNLGWAYDLAGQHDRAVEFLVQSLELRRELSYLRGEATTLRNLSNVYRNLGRVDEADMLLREAIDLRLSIGDKRGEGRAYLALGIHEKDDDEAALESFQKAIRILGEAGDQVTLARAWLNSGIRLKKIGNFPQAQESFASSFSIYRAADYPLGQAEALIQMADLQLRQNQFADALAEVERGARILDSIRSRIGNPQLKSTFGSVSQRAYEMRVELLMAMHTQFPGEGHDISALMANDWRLARSLAELIRQSQIDLYGEIDPEIAQHRVELLEQIGATAAYVERSTARDKKSPVLARARRDLSRDLAEIDALDLRIHNDDPRIDQLTEPESPTLANMQKQLDPNSVLLHFYLGEDRSYLWVVTETEMRSYELEPRAEIEALVRQAHDAFSHVTFGAVCVGRDAALGLSQTLFGEIANDIQDKRLVIVADGVLSYLAFSALPDPRAAGTANISCPPPLVAKNEVVYLPSMMVLAEQRRADSPKQNRNGVAVFADAVYGASDERLSGVEMDRAPDADPVIEFSRLRSSGDEASSITAIRSDWQVDVFSGFGATKQVFLEQARAGHRILHLATHGIIDSERPALSSVLLSGFRSDGSQLDGHLRLQDVYGLRIDADLVVLSGCETALGRQVRGEGFIGLTRGFIYAGANSVIASLWRVEDAATAYFMEQFYRGLIEDDLSPAAALRAAQLAVASRPRWRQPYYWAGFVIQGDWRQQ